MRAYGNLSGAVLAEAEGIVRRISDQYFQPNLSIEEMHALWHSNNADPLKFFGQACRAELKSMQSAV